MHMENNKNCLYILCMSIISTPILFLKSINLLFKYINLNSED